MGWGSAALEEPESDRLDDGLPGMREALAARVDSCWDRLDDAVSELAAVHGVPERQIVARVRTVVAGEGARG
jgi:hypothetical protein